MLTKKRRQGLSLERWRNKATEIQGLIDLRALVNELK